MKHQAATPLLSSSDQEASLGWHRGSFRPFRRLAADTCPLVVRLTPHLPPEGFLVFSSHMNTGDAYLLHPYRQFANWKSGNERAASTGSSAVEVATTMPKAMAILTTPEITTKPIRRSVLRIVFNPAAS